MPSSREYGEDPVARCHASGRRRPDVAVRSGFSVSGLDPCMHRSCKTARAVTHEPNRILPVDEVIRRKAASRRNLPAAQGRESIRADSGRNVKASRGVDAGLLLEVLPGLDTEKGHEHRDDASTFHANHAELIA